MESKLADPEKHFLQCLNSTLERAAEHQRLCLWLDPSHQTLVKATWYAGMLTWLERGRYYMPDRLA